MLSLILGLVFLGLGVLGLITWFDFFVKVILGIIPVSMVVVGIIAVIAGITSMTDKADAIKDEAKLNKENEG